MCFCTSRFTPDLLAGSALIMAGVALRGLAETEDRMILNAIEAGEGPPVVLLHGLFGAARNFGAMQRALAPRFPGDRAGHAQPRRQPA